MDDQFNGRTDDDLFADDFEPVEGQNEQPQTIRRDHHRTVPTAADETQPPATSSKTQSASSPGTPPSLAQSRHAGPSPHHHHNHHHSQRSRKHSPKPTASAATAATTPSGTSEPSQDAPPASSVSGGSNSDTAKAQRVSAAKPGQNTALADRLASGANPRTKPTEAELAAKMEQMRILAAEKTRRFEQAERDSRSHAIAYEKGMEEARRRRAEEAERRRRGDEERRRMDEERAANRERKLRAMGAKEGGNWDEGKNLEDERERRAGFRGANGGVRGARSGFGAGGALAASRFADKDDVVPREFGPDDFRGRGRGRGRGGSMRGGGRGGRGGFNYDNERGGARPAAQNGASESHQRAFQAPPTAEDFPALPTPAAGPKKLDTTSKAIDAVQSSSLSPGLNSPPIGKWDDEMAALDAKTAA
ncbi:hypothetical protein AAE478_007532 [Parahypoxylon ruwenzoriense]